MIIQKLGLSDHPTVINPSTNSNAFEGWGVRIG